MLFTSYANLSNLNILSMTDPKMHAQGVSTLTNMSVVQIYSNFLFLQTLSFI